MLHYLQKASLNFPLPLKADFSQMGRRQKGKETKPLGFETADLLEGSTGVQGSGSMCSAGAQPL